MIKSTVGNNARKLTINPNNITSPSWALSMPAAPIGPGVGGTIVWVAIKPIDSDTAVVMIERPAFRVKDLLRAFNITKPESAKTGIEII